MNTPIEHTEHRTDQDPLKGTGPAFARFPPRQVADDAHPVDVPPSALDGRGRE